MTDVFLLNEGEQKYFTKLTTAFFKALNREGITADTGELTLTAEQLTAIKENLPYSPANAIRKWEAATARKQFFMLMAVETYKPAPPKPETEPLESNEFFLNNYLSPDQPKTRYTAIAEWYYLRSDKSPIIHPVERDSANYRLINDNRDNLNNGETVSTIRAALGLEDFAFIPFGLYTSTAFAINACEEILKLPNLPASKGRKITIENSLPEFTDPPAAYFGDGFNTIRQGIATNALAAVKPFTRGNTEIDPVTKTVTITTPIKGGSLIVTIPGYDKLTGLKTSTQQLLDALTIILTESGAKSPTVILSLTDYMKRRGLKDRKEARKQFTGDLDVLLGTTITLTEERENSTLPIKGISVSDSWEWADKKKTAIAYTYGQTFFRVLQGSNVMPYPAQLQRLNPKKNPNSYYLLRKIAVHKNMNIGDVNNGDVIAVKTLLASAPYLPSYEEVMKSNRNLNRIIEAFTRDMDALEETLTWEYCHSKGAPLTDTELKNFNYDVFKDLLVKVTWKSYPDQTARLERKAAQIAQAKHKNKTSKKKKPDTK